MFISMRKHRLIVAKVGAEKIDRYEAALASKDETIERLCAERDSLAQANHRQAYCIQQCAAILGPETSASVDGLPKAVRRIVDELSAFRAAREKSNSNLRAANERRKAKAAGLSRCPHGELLVVVCDDCDREHRKETA